ncbi:fimbrial protein [Aeromonas hydrophila]|uniref:fimbrial protein n=1 Tax=Aeromonas TaxID=642 RepID=UPI000E567EB7|nr:MULTISPECIES: fimbrial protein [Aeromonas]AXV36053.1 fimbrial protein [Aeromonas hydrophila]EHA1066259.1 fimbrial protein [Aeromonas hydrophila]MBM0437412.1 fimbrial protein [Aeromonas hydrophila subsp. ranae]MBW3827751.1 fimbrial protein [Aeromonas hydrophila]MCX4112963.1 fimbrial protein [Aeromonas hydrophila]
MILRTGVLGIMFLSMPALAINGEVRADTKTYDIELTKEDIANQTGALKEFGWDLAGTYSGTAICPDQDIINQPFYYKAVMSAGLPSVGGGYVKLNEFLDLKVDIWIEGNRKEYVNAPFNEESNRGQFTCRKRNGSATFGFRSGSKGKVTFRVRKPIINGVHIADHEIVEMFGRLGKTDVGFNNEVMSRIVIKSSVLYVPEKCTINGGQTIEVEFGDLPGTGLDGNNFEKTVPLNFVCSGGEFDKDKPLKINLAISGKPTSFNQSYLRTTRDGYKGGDVINNLGIKFKQLDGSTLNLNDWYPVSMQGNIGDWGFTAAPISPAGAEVAAGDFYATGTIVASFQ